MASGHGVAVLAGFTEQDTVPFALSWLGWRCICIPLDRLAEVHVGLGEAAALARANTSKDPRKQVEINVAGQRLPLVNLDFLGISLAGSAIPPGFPHAVVKVRGGNSR